MKLGMEQAAELIGISVDALRHKVKHYPWRVPAVLPRKSSASPFKWDVEVFKAWLAQREEARRVSGNPKMLYLGSTAFDGAVALSQAQQAAQASIPHVDVTGKPPSDDEFRQAVRREALALLARAEKEAA